MRFKEMRVNPEGLKVFIFEHDGGYVVQHVTDEFTAYDWELCHDSLKRCKAAHGD